MNEKHVVAVFLKNNGTVLILKRSRQADTYSGRWSGVSGTVTDGTPLKQALKEIETGTGLKGGEVKFLKAGKEFSLSDRQGSVRWVVHPFLFQAVVPRNVRIGECHCDFKWIKPVDLELYETVPALDEALSRVL
jgi:ADP-ribose pyrophosphatase YjhB (NUDIX family)